MVLGKYLTKKNLEAYGFDAGRIERLSNSMQPLLTKNATKEELDTLLKEADGFVKGGPARSAAKTWLSGRFGKQKRKEKTPLCESGEMEN